MKVLITTFMLFGLLFSSDMKEDNLECFACQDGTADYCRGYADGLEANGENPIIGPAITTNALKNEAVTN